MARFYREPFNRHRDFVLSRPLTIQGASLGIGDPVDKSKLTDRRLRQLYDTRMIDYAPGSTASKPTNGHVAPPPLIVPRGRNPLDGAPEEKAARQAFSRQAPPRKRYRARA